MCSISSEAADPARRGGAGIPLVTRSSPKAIRQSRRLRIAETAVDDLGVLKLSRKPQRADTPHAFA
jgi:hypothetical protein